METGVLAEGEASRRGSVSAAEGAGWRGLWTGVVFISLLFLGHLPLLFRYVMRAGIVQTYWLYLLMLGGAVYLGWERLPEIRKSREEALGHRARGWFLGGLLVLLAASYFWTEWLGVVSAVVTLAALIGWIGGRSRLRLLAPSLVLLLFVPPSPHMTMFLTMWLRERAVGGSSSVLDLMGVVHLRSGNVLEIPGRQLMVQEACSGLNSVLAVLAVTLLMGLWRRRPAGRIVLLMFVGVLVVVLANVVRIVGGVWLLQRYQIDLFDHSSHAVASGVVFALCMLLLGSIDAMLNRFWGRDEPPPLSELSASIREGNTTPNMGSGRRGRLPRVTGFLWILAGAYLLAGLLQVRQGWASGYWQTLFGKACALRKDASFEVSGWRQVFSQEQTSRPQEVMKDATPESREHIRFERQAGRLHLALSLDYPFRGYYELTRCYASGGWQMDERDDRVEGGAAYSQIAMHMPASQGCLFFALLDEEGRWLSPREHRDYSTVVGRLRGPDPDELRPTYLIQIVTESYAPLTSGEVEDVRRLFLDARRSLADQVLGQLQKK